MKNSLRFASDRLDEAEPYASKTSAVAAYRRVVDECINYGSTPPEASLHYANSNEELREYPDFVLSMGPRGGVKIERA